VLKNGTETFLWSIHQVNWMGKIDVIVSLTCHLSYLLFSAIKVSRTSDM